MNAGNDVQPSRRGTAFEVLGAFLVLGLSAFGGPVAHLGYFRDAFVTRRRWIDESSFAELVALCQLLPGPASSQLGFLLGLARAGPLGALAAWFGFTLPSVLVMLALSHLAALPASAVGDAVLHGLKLVAVVIVAQAVIGMVQRLAPDRQRAKIALVAAALAALFGSVIGQIGVIVFGGVAGLAACRHFAIVAGKDLPITVSRRLGWTCLAGFGGLLLVLPLLVPVANSDSLRLFAIFSRAGGLVFGGGHVVLPLLRADLVPGWISDSRFLVSYGAAQALPGPLSAVAADLGSVAGDGVRGGLVALLGIFLPGLLLCVGILPFWTRVRDNIPMQRAIAGANAAVVGLLGWALYDPLATTAIASWRDVGLTAIGLAMLLRWQLPPLLFVVGMVAVSAVVGSA